jgi:hypothetical protein
MTKEQADEIILLLTQIRNEVNRTANNTHQGGGMQTFYFDMPKRHTISGSDAAEDDDI